MDNIIEPNETFDFAKVSLAHPVGIQGGAYFTKIEYNHKPLYIQTSKSLTRQGFVKTGKKYYCDLMFDKHAESIIHWFENLEEQCHKLIYDKKDAWFQGNLEESDIETAFNPLIRVYKSGKYYLLRTNVKNTKDDVPALKIYDEKERSLNMSDVCPETNVICIVDIQGIKFTSRNFQIEIELKQVMVLDNEPVFDSCLIKSKPSKEPLREVIAPPEDPCVLPALATDIVPEEHELEQGTEQGLEQGTEQGLDIYFEELTEDNIEDLNDTLKEIHNDELSLENTEQTMTLKKPNQVYFELYKEARNKAKQAKKNAIIAYLEAKNIKKTYMIDNINDSDSEFDAEIDDVSESELDGL